MAEILTRFAQAIDHQAGALDADGAFGGPVNLSAQSFYVGMNAYPGPDPRGRTHTERAFMLFDAWEGGASGDARGQARLAIVRGQASIQHSADGGGEDRARGLPGGAMSRDVSGALPLASAAQAEAGSERRGQRLLELIAPLHERARATARRLCRCNADGDDLFQDALLRAFDRLDDLRDESSFRSWFFAILLSAHRRKHRRDFWRRVLPLEHPATPE